MKVVEQFVSINGEGKCAGQLAYFIRFAGCNLSCEYCDTKWANEKNVAYQEYTPDELVDIIFSEGVKNITLTGGEPLLQEEMRTLLEKLETCIREKKAEENVPDYRIEIETNGSVDIKPFLEFPHVTLTLDYKTGVSGMEQYMYMDNYANLRKQDTVKFVVGGIKDLEKGRQIIEQYHLVEKNCGIYFSPCFGKIDPKEIVRFLIEHKLNGVNLQLQLHKFIWNPEQTGV